MNIFEYGNPSTDIVLVQPADNHDLKSIAEEFSIIENACDKAVRLIAVRVNDWNRDLSPWTAPPVFGNEDFGGGAAATLSEVLALCTDPGKTYYIGGYSLAGLFALWAVYQTDVFRGAAAASPSLWFPGFTDYMNGHDIRTDAVYLSLGTKEEKARNRTMASVGDRIREAYRLLQEKQVPCILEWNEGNHFKDPGLRTARAFLWLLKQE